MALVANGEMVLPPCSNGTATVTLQTLEPLTRLLAPGQQPDRIEILVRLSQEATGVRELAVVDVIAERLSRIREPAVRGAVI